MESCTQIGFFPSTDNVLPFPGTSYSAKVQRTTPVHNHTAVPIKDRDVLASIKSRLLASSPKYGYRNYMIFCIGINIGLRAGDLLTLRLQDIWNENTQSVKDECPIFEEKTDKVADISFSDEMKKSIKEYILTLKNRTQYTPLFPSRKSVSKVTVRDKDDTGCLNRKSYWRILNEVSTQLGLEHVSTHTMRKTFGWNIYEMYKGQMIENQYTAIDLLQEIYNHSSSRITLNYIGITPDVKKNVYKNMNL